MNFAVIVVSGVPTTTWDAGAEATGAGKGGGVVAAGADAGAGVGRGAGAGSGPAAASPPPALKGAAGGKVRFGRQNCGGCELASQQYSSSGGPYIGPSALYI